MANDENDGRGLWRVPKRRWMLGVPIGAVLFFAAGIVFWGGFNWTMELKSSLVALILRTTLWTHSLGT